MAALAIPSARSCSPSPSALDQILQLPIISVLPVVIRGGSRQNQLLPVCEHPIRHQWDPRRNITIPEFNDLSTLARDLTNSLGRPLCRAGQERLYERKHGGVRHRALRRPWRSEWGRYHQHEHTRPSASAGRILRFPLIRPWPNWTGRTASCFINGSIRIGELRITPFARMWIDNVTLGGIHAPPPPPTVSLRRW